MNPRIERPNLILMTDAYKQTHWMQYPEGCKTVYSYLEARGGESPVTVFFGLQYIMKRYLEGVVVTQEDIEEADAFCKRLFGVDTYFNREGWQRIVDVHGGRLPIKISAVPEGFVVPTGNVLMTIENTDENLPWLTNFVETILLKVWYPISTATNSYRIKQIIGEYAEKTGGEVSPFHLNDFGYRGGPSEESTRLCGAAHLTSFWGTDTLGGITLLDEYYNGMDSEEPVGMSVFATEHSTTTIHVQEENQIDEWNFMRRCMANAPDGAILSFVSDSYDFRNTVTNGFGDYLKQDILDFGGRGGRVVVRPDSGNPIEESRWCVGELMRIFGQEENERGYSVLPPFIGVIYGDGININSIPKILDAQYRSGFAIDGRNLVFGMGGGMHTSTTRDTHQFAIKCSAAQDKNGNWIDVYKNPATMSSKSSKRGRLNLYFDEKDNSFQTVNQPVHENILYPVFVNGQVTLEYTLEGIRANINRTSQKPELV